MNEDVNEQRNLARGIGSDEQVTPEEAMHHHLRTGKTDCGEIWVWCEKCGAHSNERVCNLAKQCRGSATTKKNRLQQGSHPYTGEPNVMQPRMLLWKDHDAARLVHKAKQQYEQSLLCSSSAGVPLGLEHELAARKHFQEEHDDTVVGMHCDGTDGDDDEDGAVAWLLGHGGVQ